MSSISQAFAQAVAKADFSSINQLIVNTILQKQGHVLAKDLAQLSSQRSYVSRLLPLLQQPWNQEQLIAAGLDRVNRQLEQLIVPAAISVMARFSSDWYVIQGCRPSPGLVEIMVLTINGKWSIHTIADACFRSQSNRYAEGYLGYNYLFVGIIHLPDSPGIQEIWINGAKVNFEIQNCSDSLYIQQIDDLLNIYRQAETPIDRLPELMSQGLYGLANVLQKPFEDTKSWSTFIRKENSYGKITSNLQKISLVIPLFHRWHDFMQGHHAAFSIDPAFLQGLVEVIYVIDDPSIEVDVLNWARIFYQDSPYPLKFLSLRHNVGFGMASNIGIQVASSERIVLMNSDVMPVRPGWIDSLDQTCSSNPYALVSPILMYDNDTIQHVGMDLGFSGQISHPVPCNLHHMKGLSLHQFLDNSCDHPQLSVFALSGAVLAFSRELFLQIGGFNPIFGRGDFEDLDLSVRWKKELGPLLICRESHLWHLERQSISCASIVEARKWQERFNACLAFQASEDIQKLSEVIP